MRKIITYIFLAIAVFAIVYMMAYRATEIEVKHEGITYQAGEDYNEVLPTKLEFSGTKRVNLFQRYWFSGTVRINDEEYFLDYYSGAKMFNLLHIPEENGFSGYIGYIFIDKYFEELSIVKFTNGSWSPSGGVMLSFPSKSKEEALKINNNVMADYIKMYVRVPLK